MGAITTASFLTTASNIWAIVPDVTLQIHSDTYLMCFLCSVEVFTSCYMYCSICNSHKNRLQSVILVISSDSEVCNSIHAFFIFWNAVLWSFGLNLFPSHGGRCQHKELFLDIVSSRRNRFCSHSQHLGVLGDGWGSEAEIETEGKEKFVRYSENWNNTRC